MEAAITRAIPGKPEQGKLGEEHALTLEEVIKSYTINVAWLVHYDDVTGSIKVGKCNGESGADVSFHPSTLLSRRANQLPQLRCIRIREYREG